MLNILEKGIGESVNRACEILKKGGIIAYPTDTIYGLGVDPEISQAVERLFDLKERREEKSISLMFSGKEMLYRHFKDTSSLEKKAIDKFKPDILFHSHIHEAGGMEEVIGNTKVINVSGEGKIIEI